MDLLGILPGALKVVGKITGLDIIKQAGEALEGSSLKPEQKVELEKALLDYNKEIRKLDIEELKTVLSENLAMIQSDDKYVARARPTGLYIFYIVSATLAIGMLFGFKPDPTAILTILGPLAGVGGTYVYKRTQEKMAG